MLNLNSVMLGSANPQALADFYENVLNKKPDFADGGWFGFNVGACQLSMGPHSEVKGKATEPQRIILNFETTEVKAEFERIKTLGAKVIAEPYQMGEMEKDDSAWIATFADPDGNFFQLMPPWKD
jgi:predicted enzyme related to lactoylglutathione lyase